MKGVPGLLIAVGLGIAGAFCNWLYLAQKAQQLERVDFVGFADGVNRDTKFTEAHFTKISVPRNAVGGLDRAAVQWEVLPTVIGQTATRSFAPGEILLHQDLKTASTVDLLDTLGPEDTALGVPVDTRTSVPSMLNPGNLVSFIVPRATQGGGSSGGGPEMIGPFEILALGNRTGRGDLMRTAGVIASQENVMTIRVKTAGGQPDENTRRLLDVLRVTNYQQLPVMLHGRPDPGRGKKK